MALVLPMRNADTHPDGDPDASFAGRTSVIVQNVSDFSAEFAFCLEPVLAVLPIFAIPGLIDFVGAPRNVIFGDDSRYDVWYQLVLFRSRL